MEQRGLDRCIRAPPKVDDIERKELQDPPRASRSRAIRQRRRACLESQLSALDNERALIRLPGCATNCRRVDTRHMAHKAPPGISNSRRFATAEWKYSSRAD